MPLLLLDDAPTADGDVSTAPVPTVTVAPATTAPPDEVLVDRVEPWQKGRTAVRRANRQLALSIVEDVTATTTSTTSTTSTTTTAPPPPTEAPAAPVPTTPPTTAAPSTTAAPPPPPPPSPGGPSAEQWAALRNCESGGNYGAVSSNGLYRGAYQFSQPTWDSVASSRYPHLVGVDPATAAPGNQDAMALALWQMSGSSPWPHCGKYLP